MSDCVNVSVCECVNVGVSVCQCVDVGVGVGVGLSVCPGFELAGCESGHIDAVSNVILAPFPHDCLH